MTFSGFLTRENITLAIAILGFALSLGQLINSLLSQRKSLKINVVDSDVYNDGVVLNLQIENHSSLPIAITRLAIKIDHQYFDCVYLPQEVGTINDHILYSAEFPIQIPALGATSQILEFDVPPGNGRHLPKPLTLGVYTNRGKPIEIQPSFFGENHGRKAL